MSTPKHTPGPWVVLPEECDRQYIRIRGSALGARYKVANVITPVYDGVHEREAIETRANARLIAAAPELLDVLQEMLDALPSDEYMRSQGDSPGPLLIKMREVVAKATWGAL